MGVGAAQVGVGDEVAKDGGVAGRNADRHEGAADIGFQRARGDARELFAGFDFLGGHRVSLSAGEPGCDAMTLRAGRRQGTCAPTPARHRPGALERARRVQHIRLDYRAKQQRACRMTTDTDTKTAPQTHPFQAEVAELLRLMVHSVYSETDIFLRELISNASDACDRLRYDAIAQPALLADGAPLAIRITPDAKAQTLTISDTGIGMDQQER